MFVMVVVARDGLRVEAIEFAFVGRMDVTQEEAERKEAEDGCDPLAGRTERAAAMASEGLRPAHGGK